MDPCLLDPPTNPDAYPCTCVVIGPHDPNNPRCEKVCRPDHARRFPSFGGFIPPAPQKCLDFTGVAFPPTGITKVLFTPSSTMENQTDEPKLPKIAYTILRNQWKRDGYDATGFSDRDIDGLVAGAVDHAEHSPFVAGRLGDGSILRWLEAHKELLQIIFTLGKMILPLLLL